MPITSLLWLLVTTFIGGSCALTQIYTPNHDVTILENVGYIASFYSNGTQESGSLRVNVTHGGVVSISPIFINLDSPSPWNVTLKGAHRGHDTVFLVPKNANSSEDNDYDLSEAFLLVTVARSLELVSISNIVGWIYFVAWSISFYPQCYINWKRKSVVGLNFDFLTLNLIGFSLYSLFNCGLFWSKTIQDQYFVEHPRGLNPVLLNDVVFSLHAVVITLFTIGQCVIYEHAGQRVSNTAKGIVALLFLIFIVSLVLPFFDVFNWLQFLYICSYIKLSITLMKYVPQAVMNYRRKSTIGWSIGNVILDFTGGMLSMMQMIINAENYDDYDSIFGDPTKFGLGLFSVFFDIFFMVQHYILYRTTSDSIYDLTANV